MSPHFFFFVFAEKTIRVKEAITTIIFLARIWNEGGGSAEMGSMQVTFSAGKMYKILITKVSLFLHTTCLLDLHPPFTYTHSSACYIMYSPHATLLFNNFIAEHQLHPQQQPVAAPFPKQSLTPSVVKWSFKKIGRFE